MSIRTLLHKKTSKIIILIIFCSVYPFIHKYIFWNADQRGFYEAYQALESGQNEVRVSDFVNTSWDKFCIIPSYTFLAGTRKPIYGYELSDTAEMPYLDQEFEWGIAMIENNSISRISKTKFLPPEESKKNCFDREGSRMKLYMFPSGMRKISFIN